MEEILAEVKRLVDIREDDTSKDTKIMGYISLFQNKIKSICQRDDFPEKLNYMCVEFARKSYKYFKDLDENSNQKVEVTSASDNGQTVQLKVTEIISASDVDVDKFVNKNISEIKNYAYMGW